MQQQTPVVNTLPPVIVAVFVVCAVVEAAVSLGATNIIGGPGSIGWRAEAIAMARFTPQVQALVLRGYLEPELLLRYISYPFVHGTFTHMAFAMALWLALGNFVGDLFRPLPMAILALVATVAGAATYGAWGLATGQDLPLIGAYPPVYGLIGAYTYMIWLRLGQVGQSQLKAFRLIGMLLALQVIFAVLFGSDPTWSADLGGFIAGGLAAILLAPGGIARLRDRLRRR